MDIEIICSKCRSILQLLPESYQNDSVDRWAIAPHFCETPKQEDKNSVDIDVEYILWLIEERRRINSYALDKINFFKDGKKIEIPEDIVEYWRFTGLNNVDFVALNDIDAISSRKYILPMLDT